MCWPLDRRSVGLGSGARSWLAGQLTLWGEWLATDRAKTAIALALLILLFTRGLFRGQLIDGHDSTCYPPRLTEFARVIGDHQFPPVWAPDLSNGHGQPLFEFQPPLIYAVALPLFECGMRLADSFQLALAVLFAIGACCVYLIGRNLSFSRAASIGAAAAWLFAPYQAIDVYVSARFAESSALAVTPIALLGLLAVLRRPTLLNVTLGSFAIALVPLAHNAIAMLVLPVFAAIVITRSAISKTRWLTAAGGAAAIAGGLALSAFFWVPALLEKDYVKIELLLQGLLNWRVHIISPMQLLWGRWGFGYSVAGPNDGMSFALGPVHIALAIAGIAIGIRIVNRTRRLDAIVFAGAALAGALMATEWTAPIWARIPLLQYLQFPWRTLFLPALFIPLLALCVFERIGARATAVVIALLVLFNLSHTQPKSYLTYDEEYYYPAYIARNGLNTTTREENESRWVHARMQYTGDGLFDGSSRLPAIELSSTSTRHVYRLQTAAALTVTEPTSYYPDWTVLVDGREAPITPSPIFGTITFPVAPGQHVITVDFRPTPIRRFAVMVSIVVLAMLLLAGAYAVAVGSPVGIVALWQPPPSQSTSP